MPRIPRVKKFDQFKEFSKIGKLLKSIHINFEEAKNYELNIEIKKNINEKKQLCRVEKMKFFKNKEDKNDSYSIRYNDYINLHNVPKEAFDYKVNSKSPLEWIMERQCYKVDKDSLIVNDANDFANETMKNPAYPLELLQKVITVSLETQKLIKSLPKLDI